MVFLDEFTWLLGAISYIHPIVSEVTPVKLSEKRSSKTTQPWHF